MSAGRFRRRRPRKLRAALAPDHDERVAAFRIVYAAIEERLGEGRNPFDAWALSAAAEAVIKHPNAGDEQIMEFLRWFSSDSNPMP